MNTVQKVATTAISIGAGFVGSKLVDQLWLGVTGNKAPRKGSEEAAEASLRQALGFAIFSAIVAATIQVLADRGTNKVVARFSK